MSLEQEDLDSHGTTVLVLPLRDGILLGYDSRKVYHHNPLRIKSETSDKMELVTREGAGTLATVRSGYAIATKRIQEYIRNRATTRPKESLGSLARHTREYMETQMLYEGRGTCFLSGVSNNKLLSYCFKYNYSKDQASPNAQFWEVKKLEGSGSGYGTAVEHVQSLLREDYEHDYKKTGFVMEYALLEAALHHYSTGGNIKVQYLTKYGIEELCDTFIDRLYIKFFDILDGDQNATSCFLIYKLEHYYDESATGLLQPLEKWIDDKGAQERGHPLLKLAGGFYLQRVRFSNRTDVEAALRRAKKDVQDRGRPFTSKRRLSYYIFGNHKVYISGVSREFLRALICVV